MIYQAEVITQSGSLNIRSGAGTKYPVIGRLAKGEIVDVLEEKDGWAHIIDGKEGWVSMAYLKRVPGNAPDAPQTEDGETHGEEPETHPAKPETSETTHYAVVVLCDSREEAERYAGNIKNAYIVQYDRVASPEGEKPPDA